ncbi:MAG TPA: hydrogenase maturation protease [Segeticoccus sp.]|uniref:hydrogenase maturation protease n=1 Tax=Segeticoccus sp. TaxID=2706531 RepID=UPI002D7E7384|nr:hydrogenase maturation protease [Segeticoccus sp.]HET8600815.1 hydrogenase maturation protease [Segeticoccus sp.]
MSASASRSGGTPTGRVLVAGIGNIFLGDDGFGVEVARRLAGAELPERVDVVDYGIRGVHLAYELLDGRYDTLVLVDAVPFDGEPGALTVLEARSPGGQELTFADAVEAPAVDAHSMNPEAVLRVLHGLGGGLGRVLVVGCRPAVIAERIGLSEEVNGSLDAAVRLVLEVAGEEAARLAETSWAPATTGRRRA